MKGEEWGRGEGLGAGGAGGELPESISKNKQQYILTAKPSQAPAAHPPDNLTEPPTNSLPLHPTGAAAAMTKPSRMSRMPAGTTSLQVAVSSSRSAPCCGSVRSSASGSCRAANRCCCGRWCSWLTTQLRPVVRGGLCGGEEGA